MERPQVPADASSSQATPVSGCEALVLLRVHNFPLLRRHLGQARSRTLAVEIANRIAEALPGLRAEPGARDLVEIHTRCASRDEAESLVATLADLLRGPFDLDGESHAMEVSIGAALADRAPRDEVRLAEEAERALDEARPENPVIRDLASASPSLDRLTLATDLVRAVEEDELFVQYQPKVHVRSHCVTGVEALIRWRHPVRGLILPGDFIPLAEQTRAIGPMTLWTIRRAIEDQRRLRAHGHDLRVFVNIAGVLLSDSRFIRQACDLICENGAQIGFEVTETSVIRDPESAIANLNRVSEVGITVSIDDYGAGLSSLAYLKRLPARELKIDKLFVTQLTSSNRDPLIVRSTIDLAHALEMDVVAEGVETPAALALLGVMGCDMVQGYLISRPIGFDALVRFLDEDRHREATEASRTTVRTLSAAWKRG